MGGAVSGLTTVGWDAVVDNVVVLGVALPVWAETVELSCGERAAVGKKGGTTERARTSRWAQVGALRPFPTDPGRGRLPQHISKNEETETPDLSCRLGRDRSHSGLPSQLPANSSILAG